MAIPPPKKHSTRRRNEIIKFLVFRTLGNFLVLFTIFGLAATFGPVLYYEAQYHASNFLQVRYAAVAQEQVPEGPSELEKIINSREGKVEPNLLGSVLSGDREEILYPKDPEFSVVVPKIGANERIVANVDPDNEEEYLEVLRFNIAHAKGTAFPGMNGTTYLFAHSTDNFWDVGRYNAAFYLINKLNYDDDVVVFFGGKRFNYKVTKAEIIDPSDVHFLTSNIGQGEKLILQTCWPPGTAWKRLLVFAELKR